MVQSSKHIKLLFAALDLSSCREVVMIEPQWIDTNNLTAQKNGDGNDIILFITIDQEHYMQHYPSGGHLKGRNLLHKISTDDGRELNALPGGIRAYGKN